MRYSKITIVTIVKNDKNGLEKTVESIRNQDARNFEYIIVDGESCDGGTDVIKCNQDIIDEWVSRADSGISEAFNTGIAMATGDYILFLNAGDIFRDKSVVQNLLQVCEGRGDIFIGKILLKFCDRVEIVGKKVTRYRQYMRNYFPHQAMLIKKNLFDEYGVYDLNYCLGMDYEWSLRVVKKNIAKIVYLDMCITIMNTDGISMGRYNDTYQAYHRARIKNCVMPLVLSVFFSKFFTLKHKVSNAVRRW